MWRHRSLAWISLLVLLSLLVSPLVVLAQGEAGTSAPFRMFTSYPAREVAKGGTATFDISLQANSAPQTVSLEVQGLPEGWKATLRGGGDVIRAAYVQTEDKTSVSLKIEVPAEAAPDTYRFALVGKSEQGQVTLPLELIVQEKLPPTLTWEVKLPTLRGNPTTTFRYDATLRNEGGEDLNVNLVYEVPQDFKVVFRLLGQDVSSFPIKAGESKSLTIEVDPPDELPAGQYKITLRARGGETEAETTLTADVTPKPGSPVLSISGADGRLSGDAYAGKENTIKIVVRNTGSAAAEKVKLSSSEPSGWTVTFDPEEIAAIPVNEQVEVKMTVKPADKAIAGDYMISITAKPEKESSKSVDFRITVRTSTLWGVVGVALIAVAVGVVAIAVLRFGRR
ncbi:MAG: COG1470 family protein [Anaerolineae bacterium]